MAERMHDCWEIVLRHQFHDIIPGSSIAGVYEDSKKEYAIAWDIARNVEETAYNSLLEEQENTWTVLNNAGWTANSLAVVEGAGKEPFSMSPEIRLKYRKKEIVPMCR
ncbi:MAG: hypothetical protein V8S12_08410 [Lachnospiraceae bacterium]